MKTIQDLVDNLNLNYDLVCRVEKTDSGCFIEDDTSCFIHFENGHWDIHGDFCMLHREVQKYIMDFVYTTNPNDWFAEKKYNIIIGGSVLTTCATAYCKDGQGKVMLDTFTSPSELKLDDYQFTESEIEELKSTLPTNMAKIVDLGKVEVKDD